MKILLVEDHKLLSRSLKQALEEDGFAVDLAVAGDEADAKARGAIYDVVIIFIIQMFPHHRSCNNLAPMVTKKPE